MKIKYFFVLFAVLSLTVVSASAQSGLVDLFTTTVPLSTTTNAAVNQDSIALPPDKTMAFIASYSLLNTNNGVTLQSFGFNLSFDNTIWTTTTPAIGSVTNNTTGTNTVGHFILSTNLTQNARYIRMSQIINGATNNAVINSLRYRFFP